jgi:hypothetical protein
MGKVVAFLLILLLNFTLLYAQEDETPPDGDWDYFYPDSNTGGDQTVTISFGTVFPTVFFNNGQRIDHNFKPPVGGTGTLSYNYYINSNFFVGGEINLMFLSTIGENMYYAFPLGVRAGYQLYFWRLEFPINFTVGMVWHRYLSFKYYGLYLKGGPAAYFRFSSSWSFGLSSNWYWLPQWTDDRSKNVYGNMIDLTLSARYHF